MAFGTIDTGTGTGTSVVRNKPTDTVSGDVLVFAICFDTVGGTVTWPSGFTQISSSPLSVNSPDGESCAVAVKVAGGSEPSSYTATLSSAGGGHSSFLARYTNIDNTTPVNANAGATNTTGGSSPRTVTASSITTNVDGCDILFIAATDNTTSPDGSSWAAPSGYTERADVAGSNWSNITLADKVQSTQGATGAADGTASFTSGSAGWLAFHLALAPAAGGGGGTVNTETAEDTLSVADGFIASAIRTAFMGDDLVMYDEIIKTISGTYAAILSDVVQVSDSVPLFMLRSRMLSDDIIVDEGPLFRQFQKDSSDTLDITDQQLFYLLRRRMLDDSLEIYDEVISAVIQSAIITKILSSFIDASDGLDAWLDRSRSADSGIAIDDFLLRAQAIAIQLTEAIEVSDDKIATLARFLSLDDSLLVVDENTATYIASVLYNPRMVIGTDQPKIKLGGYAL